jgi:hypothetical protein
VATVLDLAYQRQLIGLRRATSARVATVFTSLGDWSDDAVFVERAVPIAHTGARAAVALTDAYLARSAGIGALGVNPQSVVGSLRNGADPAEVYRRPLTQLWNDLSNGKPFPDALAGATTRASTIAETDVGLAARDAVVEWAAEAESRNAAKIYGWERVTDGDACTFCLLASTQRYTTDQLMPMHDHCFCSVAPLMEPYDQVIRPDLLEDLNAEGVKVYRGDGEVQIYGQSSDGTEGDGVAIREHGELGPVLVNPDHNFRDAADAARDTDD